MNIIVKFSKKTLIICLAVITVLIAGSFLGYRLYHYVGTNDAIIDGFSVNIGGDILGRITRLLVDEGDFVKQGDLLYEIDNTILLAQKIESEAQIVTFEKEVELQEINMKKIEDDYWRAEKAFKDHIISGQDYDHAQKNYGIASKQYLVAKAKLQQAKATLGIILAQLEHTLVFAPRDGMITKRWALAGDVIKPGQSVFSLYDLKDVWVIANLEEKKISHVKVGDTVKIHVDAYRGRTFHGKVFAVLGAAASQYSLIPQDNATGNYTKVAQRIPIKITIDPKDDKHNEPLYLFPGLSVEVNIEVRK